VVNKMANPIVSFLKRDHIRNMDAIYSLQDYNAQSLERIGNSVLLRGGDRPWVYVSSTDQEELILVARLTDDDRCFAAIEEWMVPILTRDKTVMWDLSMMRWILRRNPFPFRAGMTLKSCRSWKKIPGLFTIICRIRNSPRRSISGTGSGKGPMEASTGKKNRLPGPRRMTMAQSASQNVFRDCRRKGYAHALTIFLVNRVREQRRIPYLHIEETNTDAMNSHQPGFPKGPAASLVRNQARLKSRSKAFSWSRI
jgi:hypothetical protein